MGCLRLTYQDHYDGTFSFHRTAGGNYVSKNAKAENLETQKSGLKAYHLGNVLSVISDKPVPHTTNGTTVDYYMADIMQSSDYSAFHAPLSGRTLTKIGNSKEYRYGGSNGQEKTDELSGKGNHYTAEYWEYDARSARRWNIDPVIKEHESPYAVFANNPIMYLDPNGADTSNVQATMELTNSSSAFNSLIANSPTFNDFFQSFVDGENKGINLRLTDNVADPLMKGFARLNYKGTWVGDLALGDIPVDAKLEDFEIEMGLNSALYAVGNESNVVDKMATLIHEFMLHANKEVEFLNASLDKTTSIVNGETLINTHNPHYLNDLDHKNLEKPITVSSASYSTTYCNTYREMIDYYSGIKPWRLTNDFIYDFSGKTHYKPFQQLLQENFNSETSPDKRKKIIH